MSSNELPRVLDFFKGGSQKREEMRKEILAEPECTCTCWCYCNYPMYAFYTVVNAAAADG